MLHELVHNEISEHSDKFYTRLEEVRPGFRHLYMYIFLYVCDQSLTLLHVCLYIYVCLCVYAPPTPRSPPASIDLIDLTLHATTEKQLTAECEQLMVKGLNALTSRHIPYEGK
jgi:hypothetical protein